MKKVLLSIITALAVMHSVSGYAQTATFTTAGASAAYPNADTVYGTIQQSSGTVNDFVTATISAGVIINWKVTASNFPADWTEGYGQGGTASGYQGASLGVCDNKLCQVNGTNTGTNRIWNPTTNTGTLFTSLLYAQNQPGIFELSMDMATSPTVGRYYLTVLLTDAASNYSKTITFILSQWTTAVPNVTKGEDDIALYPNPATSEVNVVYSPDANVKTISVYNIIGKVVKVYNTLDNSSAKLSIDNIPAGIYFVRLMDGQGRVVATRKFTRQ